jgi:acyl-CoA synthetase (AMP-forming)/AMP-acid ligase II
MRKRRLLSWLKTPASRRGIYFALPGEVWDFWSYRRLAEFTHRIAAGLLAAGVGENDVVSFILRSGPSFVATFFGTLLAGATPSPIAPALVFQGAASYAKHVRGVLQMARPALIVTEEDGRQELEQIAPRAGLTGIRTVADVAAEAGAVVPFVERPPARLALLQFTSGSSGQSRGILVPFRALEENVAAIRHWLRWTEEDTFASWLPLHHDMGLIGGLISSVVSQSDLRLLQPEEFVRNPLRYLQCFGAYGAKLTVTASFGLDYLARKVRPEALMGLDFSAWRGMVVGAERIERRALESVYRLLSPHGFRRQTILPAYGLAEATLAVTGLPLDERWTSLTVEPESLAIGRRVVVCDEPQRGQHVTGCGRPLAGVSVFVVDENDRRLPDGTVGEIVVSGSSVAAGYKQEDDTAALTRFANGRLYTGDAGFFKQGQLYVLGRLGDSLKVRGRVIFSEDMEETLGALALPRHRLVALLGVHEGKPHAVIVIEGGYGRPDALRTLLRRQTAGAEVVLIEAEKGTIARTSSGKPRRRHLWRAFIAGKLAGSVVKAGDDLAQGDE